MYTQDPIKEYRSRNRGMYDDVDQRTQESHTTVQDLRLMEENSYLDRIMEGQHGSRFMRFDLSSKTLEVYDYDKEKEFDPEKSLGVSAFKKEMKPHYESKVSIRYGNSPKIMLDKMSQGIADRIEINTIRAEIIVFGDSMLRSGQCLNVNLPIWNQDQQEIGDRLTGKFLMSEIHHQITHEEKYIQTIMIQKEAYEDL